MPSAKINDFRRGMLAKCAVDGTLMSARVLKCRQPGCFGDRLANDRCENRCDDVPLPDKPKDEKPTWWLWVKNDREPVECRRCNHCRRLYFQFRGPCPNPDCRGHHDPSVGGIPTKVWFRVGSQPLGPHHQPALPDESSPEEAAHKALEATKLAEAIGKLPEHLRTVATRVLLEKRTFLEAAIAEAIATLPEPLETVSARAAREERAFSVAAALAQAIARLPMRVKTVAARAFLEERTVAEVARLAMAIATLPEPLRTDAARGFLDERTFAEATKLAEGIEMRPEPQRTIARRVLVEGWTFEQAAEEQGLEPESKEFKNHIRAIKRRLAEQVQSGEADDDSEVVEPTDGDDEPVTDKE